LRESRGIVGTKQKALVVPGGITSELITGMVVVFFPDEPHLTATQEQQVRRDVATFVAGQLRVMPAFLRIPYIVGLHAFDWLAILRYGLPYSNLNGVRRQHYIAFWTNSPISAMRDFVKLIRTNVLLAYLDHPIVTEALENTTGD
jgi:hypothetical protein